MLLMDRIKSFSGADCRLRYLAGAAFLLIATTLPISADIYMSIDSEGVMHFTNVPTSSSYQLYLKEDSVRSSTFSLPVHYDHIISEASDIYGVEFPLVKAIIKAESNFDPQAVSKAGAMGLMQIMPHNFDQLDIKDPFDPWQNVKGGTAYFKRLLKRYNEELALALAAYNAGPERVDQYKGVPPFEETEAYVERVMKYYMYLKNHK
jgi:soluble lytic murein transglycosylase